MSDHARERTDAATLLHASLSADLHAAQEEWLSVKEYAASRKVHEQTVYSAIRRKLFPYHVERIGKLIRIDVSRGSIEDRIAS